MLPIKHPYNPEEEPRRTSCASRSDKKPKKLRHRKLKTASSPSARLSILREVDLINLRQMQDFKHMQVAPVYNFHVPNLLPSIFSHCEF